MDKREILISYAVHYDGDWAAIAAALQNREPFYPHRCIDRCITIYDEDYPSSLMHLRYPPWVLFYRGNKDLLKEPMAAVVGSRDLSAYGYLATCRAVSILSERFVIVSGLAKGADAAAHQEALRNGKTIGVIGSGLGTVYPPENRQLYQAVEHHGLILSEYPHQTGVRRHHFPWRNRILAALGQFVVVTQAAKGSGSAITANEAAALGKDVWCFPYPFNDEKGKGCNQLIADGAIPVYDLEQLKDLRTI